MSDILETILVEHFDIDVSVALVIFDQQDFQSFTFHPSFQPKLQATESGIGCSHHLRCSPKMFPHVGPYRGQWGAVPIRTHPLPIGQGSESRTQARLTLTLSLHR